MEKLSAWLFVVIALMWLLPLVGVATSAGAVDWGMWISTIALAVIGLYEAFKK